MTVAAPAVPCCTRLLNVSRGALATLLARFGGGQLAIDRGESCPLRLQLILCLKDIEVALCYARNQIRCASARYRAIQFDQVKMFCRSNTPYRWLMVVAWPLMP